MIVDRATKFDIIGRPLDLEEGATVNGKLILRFASPDATPEQLQSLIQGNFEQACF